LPDRSEWYEARAEAAGEIAAERAREMYGGSPDELYHHDAVLELIEVGDFDEAVVKRAKVLGFRR